jgi:hypothetical protein
MAPMTDKPIYRSRKMLVALVGTLLYVVVYDGLGAEPASEISKFVIALLAGFGAEDLGKSALTKVLARLQE